MTSADKIVQKKKKEKVALSLPLIHPPFSLKIRI